MVIDYNLIWIIGGIVSTGFSIGLTDSKVFKDKDLFSIIFALAFVWLISWVGVIASIVEQVRKYQEDKLKT